MNDHMASDEKWKQPATIDWSKHIPSSQMKSPQLGGYVSSNKDTSNNSDDNENKSSAFDFESRYTRNKTLEIPINDSKFKLSTHNSKHNKQKKSHSQSMTNFDFDFNIKKNNYLNKNDDLTNDNSNKNSDNNMKNKYDLHDTFDNSHPSRVITSRLTQSNNNNSNNNDKHLQPSAYQKSRDFTINKSKYHSLSSININNDKSRDSDITMSSISSFNSMNKSSNSNSNNNVGNNLMLHRMNRKKFNKYDESVIRPTDRVVLYSPFTHCYVCINNNKNKQFFNFADSQSMNNYNNSNNISNSSTSINSHKTMLLSHDSLNLTNTNSIHNSSKNNSVINKNIGLTRHKNLYLECNDMEGTPLKIGETQFAGTCRFLTDCKIQLMTGQGLSKERNKITISMQATKFMLDSVNDNQHKNTGSIHVGNKVFIYIEASKINNKQFWSIDTNDNNTIVLKECHKPGIRETFILQKFGQPLTLEDDRNNIMDGELIDNFLSDAALHVQEYYLCKDILNVLSKQGFCGDFIKVMSKFEVQEMKNSNDKSGQNENSMTGMTDDMPIIICDCDKFGIETVLSSAVKQLLPLMQNTQQVRYFVNIHERCEYGIVSQALCFEMKRHLKDFNMLLVQLESRLNKQELTLQNLKFYLQRATRTMQALQHLCIQIHSQYGINNSSNNNNNNISNNKFTHVSSFSFVNYNNNGDNSGLNTTKSSFSTISSLASKTDSQIIRKTGHYSTNIENISRLPMNAKGGGLLNILQRAMDTSGEKHVRLLYTQLMKSACVPYFDMLANWIYKGVINDIYDEFMIGEKAHLKKEDIAQEYNNEYWTSRYSINSQQIPSMLYDYQDLIVTTGKYLNVMRESGCPIQPLSFDSIENSNNNSNNGNNNTNKENMSVVSNHSSYFNNINNNNSNNKNDNNLVQFKHSLHKCNPRDLGHYIREAYHFASKALLEMLMNRERIMDRFRSIQRYMLLSEGDWFEYFIDMSESILNQNAADVKIVKLNRLLELSIRTSVSKNDIFKDDVCCDIKNKDLNTTLARLHDLKNDFMLNTTTNSVVSTRKHGNSNNNNNGNNNNNNSKKSGLMGLTGMQAFALDYKVEWPASIIFTGRNVTRYQLIFRLLFKLKIVQRQLKVAWKQQMCLRQFNLENVDNESLLLRQKMLQFIESLLFYIFYEVIEPNWCQFIINMKKSNTVDALLQLQDEFLRQTMHMCLLTDNKHVESLFSVLSACEGYATYISRYTQDWKINFEMKQSERRTVIKTLGKDFRDSLTAKTFVETIEKYSTNFQNCVKEFLTDLHQSSTMNMNTLLSRLDFNAYYMPKILF